MDQATKELHLHRFQMMFLKISYLTTSYILHLRTTTHGLYYFNVLLKKRTNKFMHCSTSNNLFAAPSVYYFVWSLQVIELIFHKQGIIAVPKPGVPSSQQPFCSHWKPGDKNTACWLACFFSCLISLVLGNCCVEERRWYDLDIFYCIENQP